MNWSNKWIPQARIRKPKKSKESQACKTPAHGNLNSKKGDIRLSEMNSNGLKEMEEGKKKALEEMNPHLLFFPMVKLQKTSPQLRSTRHLSNPFDCILKRIWELASFGGFCCSFCMSLFWICPRGFYSCNLDI